MIMVSKALQLWFCSVLVSRLGNLFCQPWMLAASLLPGSVVSTQVLVTLTFAVVIPNV
jgi:hypothetical protein